MALKPHRHDAGDADLAVLLTLIQDAFSAMDGVVDPPSSAHRLTVDDLRNHCRHGELWSLGARPIACMLLAPEQDSLYVGKLAVHENNRGQGLARLLIAHAESRARARNLPAIELQSRVELTRNHAIFSALGFTEIARSAHPGYIRPTSIRFRKRLG